MARGLIIGLAVIGAVFASTGSGAPHASTRAWTLAEAQTHLAAAGEFTAIDLTQADRPRFWITVGGVGRSALHPIGRGTVVRGIRKWRDFRFSGRVSDSLTGTRPSVRFDFSPAPAGGVRIRDFRGPPPNATQPAFPIRGAFYYGWFPELWTQGGLTPYTHYLPSLGFYESGNTFVLRRHVEAMRYGGLHAGIWSWWGIGDPTDARFATALAVARPTPLRWAVYHEREGYGNPDPEEIRRDLLYVLDRYGSKPSYLRIDGRPVVFVYSADDQDCSVVDRWARGNPGGVFVVLKVFGGYRDCPTQPDGWHQYGASFATAIDRQEGYATTIMPGFWLADRATSPFARDPERWRAVIRELAASGDPFQLVVSFNEWGEGTAVESAFEWATPSGHGAYLDALHEELGFEPYAAKALRSSTVEPRSVSRRSKSPAQSDERSGAASRLAAVVSPSRARTSTASSR